MLRATGVRAPSPEIRAIACDGAAMPRDRSPQSADAQFATRVWSAHRQLYQGVIDKTEFEPRIAGLKQRMSQLQERHRQPAMRLSPNANAPL
jgi:hypothetical protein